MSIQTDKEINANNPDILVKDKEEKNCLFIYFHGKKDLKKTLAGNLSKYKNLEIERISSMKTPEQYQW